MQTHRVVDYILAGAHRGNFQPTHSLPSERELAEDLAVSRATVTTAYNRLEERGVLRRVRGKGAFLCALPTPSEAFSWNGKISRFANALDEPVLELLARSCAGDIRFPLSAGTPSLAVFPRVEYARKVAQVLDSPVPSALAVAPSEGQWTLRETLGTWLGLPPQNLMITAGAQEGIDLVARCLIEPGNTVLVDAPCYPGALQSFLSAGARLVSWNVDWSLAQCETLLLRYRPKLIFTTPSLQNPTGRVMGLKTRLGLIELARRYHVPILEDDVYGRTFFDGQVAPESLYKLDKHTLVIKISTFSKMLAPGLRVGWIAAPRYMVKQLALIKMRSNLFTGGLTQFALAEMIRSGEMDQHIQHLREHHCTLRDVAVEALKPSVRDGLVRFQVPSGSLYLWCKVLLPIDMEELFAELEKRGVSVAPGGAFEPDRSRSSQHFRICFSALERKPLQQALRILNSVLARLCSVTKSQDKGQPHGS